MKTAGIREARQNLSALIEEVRRGHELVLTDRGRPVARLVPPSRELSRPFPGRSAFRRSLRGVALHPLLSLAVGDDREERG